jgi:hypothetical protein
MSHTYHAMAKLAGTNTKVGTSITDEFMQDMPKDYIKHTIVESLAGVVYNQAKKDIEDALDASEDFPPKWQSVGYSDGGFVYTTGVGLTNESTYALTSAMSTPESNHLSSPTALKNKLKDAQVKVLCPAKDCVTGTSTYGTPLHTTVWSMIQHLNDRHKWKREDIADWLETLDLDLTIGEKS